MLSTRLLFVYLNSNVKSVTVRETLYSMFMFSAAVLNMFLYGGQGKAQGLFFLEYQKRFASSAAETTIMSTIQNITTCIGGIIHIFAFR